MAGPTAASVCEPRHTRSSDQVLARAGIWLFVFMAAAVLLAPRAAHANCFPNNPGARDTVTCNINTPNPETTPVSAQRGASNVEVNVLPGAQLAVSGTAITLTDGDEIDVFSGAVVQGTTGISVTGSTSVSNAGTITGTAGPAIVLNAPGNSQIDNIGTISGGIQLNTDPRSALTLTNEDSGAINGDVTGSGNGEIDIVQEGTFNGGVSINGNGTNVIRSDVGRNFNGAVSVTGASNTVVNGGSYNAGLSLTASLANIVVNKQGAFINQGLSLSGALNSLDNAGILNGGLGISGNGANTMINRQGAIINQPFSIAGSALNAITNLGTVNATMNVSGSGLLFNSGTISGGATAIAFTASPSTLTSSSSPFTLELAPGFVINGAVLGTGSDTLELGGTGSGVFNVGTIGPQYQGFSIFEKVDSSSWTLTGTGAQNWIIKNGTLIGDTNSLQGNALSVGDHDSLVFNQSFSGTYAGAISNEGDVTLAGGGTVTFTGANTYTGGTTIAAGSTLQLGQGGASGSVKKNITDKGALVFDRSDTFSYSGQVSGSGSVTQAGSGTAILSGQSSYSGATTVAAGTLEVDGAIARSDISILSGARLAGNGVLGPTTIAGGGTLEPGTGGVGLQVVQGDLSFQSGANFVVSVSPHFSSTVFVTGDSGIAGTLTAVALGGPFTDDAIFPVVISAGTRTGTFSSLVQSGDFGAAALSLIYTPHNVFLDVNASPVGPPVWDTAPTSSDWNTASNWVANVVPAAGAIAHFGVSSITTVTIAQPNTQISGLAFDAGAPRYKFAVTGSGVTPAEFILGTSGVSDRSASGAASFAVAGTAEAPGRLVFNASTIADQSDITSNAFGTTLFVAAGTAANARLLANSGGAFDFSGIGTPQFTAGSIEGAGTFNLGSAKLVVGGTNLNTTVSGIIADGGESGGIGGSLFKIGSGTLLLTGDNSYTGVTQVAGGVLQIGNGGTTGSIAGDLIVDTAFVVDRSGSFTYSGNVSGGGDIVVSGTGALEYAGTATNTGNATVAAGAFIVHGIVDGVSTASVGDGGTAELVIDSGGDVTDVTATLGNLAGTTGTAIVSGAGSTWTSSGVLTIGGAGTGVLDISDSAIVTASAIDIAVAPGSVGTLAIGALGGRSPEADGTLDPPTVTFGAGTGTVIFNHTDAALFFGAPFAGHGAIEQDGTGTTILTADSRAFTGATTVNAGTLDVAGTLGNSVSTLQVNAGGTLDGTGSIGGAVSVASGGILSGAQGQAISMGPLTLQSGASLDVLLGGTPPPTPLFVVNGALTLGGTLNIEDFGGFAAGVYRLIDYSGTLTDNGLAIGTVPPGVPVSELAVQTSVAGQINLVNTTGVALRFWDGGTTPNDGVIEGGSGTWDAVNSNWTDVTGTLNGSWSTDFAVFGATPGTVAVDDVPGQISSTGMQFAVDGYRLTGDPLALSGSAAVIRVGDGTANGAAFTATIDNVLSGGATLIKTDKGTLILNGTNTYTGGTLISDGTLEISSDANLGAATGALAFGNGTLETTADIISGRAVDVRKLATLLPAAGTTLEFDGVVSGAGELAMTGQGTLILNGADITMGPTKISAGTLQIGTGGTTGSVAGDVQDDSALVANRLDSVVLPGVITGTGSFTQAGAGTTILAGDSAYSGGTTIAQGTLQLGNGGTSGSIIGPVSDNGTFAVSRSDSFELSNTINGNGAFEQVGPGTTILSGSNTYTGGTTVGSGTLQIGDTSVRGSIVGDVTDNATLAFARSDRFQFDGVISGTGALAQSGNGELILTAAQSYTGGTTVANGLLALGNGGASGSIVGAVIDNATLVLNRSDSFTFDNAVSGSGDLLQVGAGTAIVTGTSSYTGLTGILSGQLTIHGALTGTDLVRVGGSSGGSLLIENGGTVTDNNAILALLPNRTGTATITGGGSQWTTSGALEIGDLGTAVVTIANAGTVNAGSVFIAEDIGSTGTLNIGAPLGSPAAPAGFLDPPTITFGTGTGTIVFNHTDPAYVFGAPIAGFGAIEQDGPGKTILSADSSAFTGVSTVNGGTLDVAGTLGSPASALAVSSGGTLTGTGSVSGNVLVESGGTLSGIQGQTLTTGSLTLASGAILDVTLGVPGTQALFAVNGALTLGGTLDITDQGGFSPGVYRLIDYSGALTDNGVAFGTLPSGLTAADLSVQTSVAGQVNLVNTAGVTLQFWDGGGTQNNGAIEGGSGVWNTLNRNWTDSTGAVNGTWATDFAIFGAAQGSVTVDASAGPIAATGMQFAVDGYRLSGDPIALDGTAAVIRVGDGTAAGAGFTATIDNALSGSATLIKTDQGTLVLGGANTYTGGTLIARGTLAISSDANLGAATGALAFGDATLETRADIVSSRAIGVARSATFDPLAGTSLELHGPISGPGSVTMAGAGTLIIAGTDSAAGQTTIAAGTLQVGNGGMTGSIAGSVVDNGTFAIDRSDSVLLGGVITGTGSLSQTGTGTTILAVDESYSGGTSIAQGTLQLGNGGATGSVIGTITDNGTLAVDRSDAFTLGKAISGSGALAQIGPGTTILTAANTYAGGTTVSAGALQIGNGNLAGSIIGNVTDNALLVFDRADSVTFGGIISGSGALAQTGSGTLILTGRSTYTGGTAIASGTLQLGAGDATGSIQGPALDDGFLAVNRSDSFTLDSAISGTGAFAQIGTGTTTLAGSSSYTGPTAVTAGQLTVQGALAGTSKVLVGGTGGAALVIENGGVVSDESAGLGVLAGTRGSASVSGANSQWSTTGAVIVGGGGTGLLTISNGAVVTANSFIIAQFAGSTGTIAIGAPEGAAATSSGTLDPPVVTFGAGAATVVFNHSDTTTVTAMFAGSGAIRQTGPGTTILTANSSAFTGSTTVNAGTLEVDGVLGGVMSAVAVSGGTLSGIGTLGGSAYINTAGTLAPGGGAIGALHVGGNLNFAPDATYRVGLTPAAADLTTVAGTATLAGDAQVIAAPGDYPANATYPILIAAGGVSGTFDRQVTISSVFLEPSLQYSANEVDLILAAETFPAVAETPNQRAVADAVQSLPPGNPVFDAVFDQETGKGAQQAFDALSGEVHASTAGVMIQDSRYVREAVLSRLRGSLDTGPRDSVSIDLPASDPPHNVWFEGLGAFGGADGDGNAANLDRSIAGVIGGADMDFDETWRGGLAAAYTRTIVHEDVRASRASSNDVSLALYGSGRFDAVSLRAGAAYAWHDIDTKRAVMFPGFAEAEAAHYHGRDAQAFGEIGYALREDSFVLEPFGDIAYVNLDTDAFAEKDGAAALSASARTFETAFTTLGGRADGIVGDIAGAPVHLNLTLGWVHAFGDVLPGMTFAFLSGGAPFTVLGTPLARDSALVETGFGMDITESARVSFLYSGELAAHARDNSFKAALIWNF